MITIELQDVRVHAFHGIYEGERTTGNPYIVNLQVKYEETAGALGNITGTINYVELYQLVKNTMMEPRDLLEQVCDAIINQVSERFPFVKEVEISVYKLQAPIEGFQGKVGVRMNRSFNA